MTADLNLDEVPAEPSTPAFTLDGREWRVRESADVPYSVIRDMFVAETGDLGERLAKISPFFEAVLAPEDWPAFKDVMDRPGSPLTLKLANLLIPHLLEKVMGIPTAPPKPSTAGRPTRSTGSKSRAGSSSQGTRRKAS